ncbi:MAG: YidC/Oxa1 family membrane protein insertase [Lachnospiraceae bacterium]|nr:YidC/Oxa1 family membrane protein insertase [Lachnospiraceae bacterium]
MAGILLTQNNTFIIGDVAKILGWIMDVLFNFLNSVFGIQNIGLCIILFTVIIYLLMLPLTIKQQKFSKLSAKMNPEIQEIQKKYKNKKDNTSMMAMNEETQAVYAKYGVSATGSCLQMLIQLPILFALYRVIMNVPAYVGGVKNVFTELAGQIMAAPGGPAFMQELQTNGRMFIEGKDFNEVNTIIDVLYKLQDTGSATWQMLIDKFPEMERLILTTQSSITSMNNFGINIANSPWNIAKSALAAGSFIMLIGAVLVPFLAALTQWLNVKMMPQPSTGGDANDTMNATMKSMNMMMPLMSAWFCFTLPAGMGLYWIMGAVVRGIQQWTINRYLDKMDLDELVKKNMEKNNRLREKKGLPPQKINEIAKTNVKAIDHGGNKKNMTEEERQAAMEASTNYYKNSDKPGSLASKAAMVAKYNEKTKK